jgi:hypothetical protein
MANNRASCLHGDLFKKIWPFYRGRRAGKLVKSRKTQRRYTIRSIQQPGALNRATTTSSFPSLLRSHNPVNCINITPMTKSTEISRRKGSERVFVPSFLLSNVQSLASKKTKFNTVLAMQIWILLVWLRHGLKTTFKTLWSLSMAIIWFVLIGGRPITVVCSLLTGSIYRACDFYWYFFNTPPLR